MEKKKDRTLEGENVGRTIKKEGRNQSKKNEIAWAAYWFSSAWK
jgi:hypothetical protein